MSNGADKCVHCHKCQKNCSFLSKYSIDIGDMDKLQELAYHCFLCGKCTEVCPIDIDGREEILNIRRQQQKTSDYKGMLSEKQDYKYRNYRHAKGKSVLFPGCNFPSLYPKTTKKLAEVLQSHDIGVVYDCCGKPVAELGLVDQEKIIVERIEKDLVSKGITEIVTMCPNCFDFLKPRISLRVVSVYEKLKELNMGNNIDEDVSLFMPCPDREKKEMLKDLEEFIPEDFKIIEDVQCCGLGGSACKKEPGLAKDFSKVLKEKNYESIYVYCASCGGNLVRNGCKNVKHVLPEIMGTHEKPNVLISKINRMLTKRL